MIRANHPNRPLAALLMVYVISAFPPAILAAEEVSPQAPPTLITRAQLIEVATFGEDKLRQLKAAGVEQVVVEIREDVSAEQYAAIERVADGQGLALWGWLEIGRDPELAAAKPHLMSTMGMHGHWREKFPEFPADTEDTFVKISPWVPIWYKQAFELHLRRIERLADRIPCGMAGFFLNHIQGPPSACGCGNDNCRWTVDYRTPPTAEADKSPDTPARFVSEARKRLGGKPVIPVWYTECEAVDHHTHPNSTGYCGPVNCVYGACWRAYVPQLRAVRQETDGAIAVGAFYRALSRDLPQYESEAGWIAAALQTFDDLQELSRLDDVGESSGLRGMITVVQGWGLTQQEIDAQIEHSRNTGVHAVLVAEQEVAQSWEPRLVAVKEVEKPAAR